MSFLNSRATSFIRIHHSVFPRVEIFPYNILLNEVGLTWEKIYICVCGFGQWWDKVSDIDI